jgi:hypothetical protein
VRFNTVFLVLSVFPAALQAQNNNVLPAPPGYRPMTAIEKFNFHLSRPFQPFRLAQVGLGAAILQWRDVPEEWELGASGYGKRFAATHGFVFSRHIMASMLDIPLRLEPRYIRSTEKNPKARLMHAIKSTFFSRRDQGGWFPAVDRIGSNYGASFLATWWLPESRGTPGDAARRGTTKTLVDLGNTVFAEFWPDIKRKMFRKKSKIPLSGGVGTQQKDKP